MRNYLKMRCLRYEAITSGYPIGAWGADDEQLGNYARAAEFLISQTWPGETFTEKTPHDVYWELNASNFAVVLNGWDFGIARGFIDDSSLITAAGVFSPVTVIESPRKTWSHGH
jgi:hypothetical protein